MFPMQNLALMQEMSHQEEAPPVEGPAEKILRLAMEMPATRPQLEREASRVEGLLDNLQAPVSEMGGHLMAGLVEVLEGQLDGIYGLLDGGEELFEQSLALLVESDGRLRALENDMEELREQAPLVA